MKFSFAAGSASTLALGLALLSADPALAQKTTVKAKNDKVKTKTTDAAGAKVAKSKMTMAPAPQPTPAVASAPQVVTAAPAPAPTPAPLAEVPAGWLTDLAVAKAAAKAANRPLLAVFSGSDWCKPCIMFEQEVFSKPEFMSYAKDKLVLAHFDFPRLKKNLLPAAQQKTNDAAAAQINREGDFPLAVLVSPEGQVLAKTGYIAGGPAAFEAYLKKTLPTL